MPSIAEAYVEVKPDTKGFGKAVSSQVDKDLDGQSGAFEGQGKKLGGLIAAGIAVGAAAAGAAFVGFTAMAIGAGSDLNESINAVNVTFGDAGAEVLKLGENAATAVGLSNNEFNGLAVQFSSFASKIAGPGGDVVGTLEDITTRSADFASVMNVEVADAAAIFQAGLAGETEGLKKFGIDLSEANVTAYAMANGIGVVGEELTEAEKVQARYGSLMEQTNKTQGDFANTADSMANGLRILKAQATDTAAVFGSAFLPGIGVALGAVNAMLPAMEPMLADLGTAISDSITPMIELLGPVLEELIPVVATVFGAIGTIIGALAPVIMPLVDIFGQVATLLSGVVARAVTALAPVVASLAEMFAGVLMDAISIVLPIFNQLMPVLSEIAQVVGGVLAVVFATLADVMMQVLQAVAPLIPILADALLTVLQALAPFLSQIAEMFGVMATALIDALVPVLPVLVELLIQLLDAFLPLLPVLLELVEAALPVFVQLVEQLSPLLVTVGEILTRLLVPAVELVVAGMTIWIQTILIPIYDFISAKFGPVLSGIADIARDVADWFVDMGVRMQGIYNNNLVPLGNWLSSTFGPVFVSVGQFVTGLGDTFRSAWGEIQGIYDNVVMPIYRFFNATFGVAFDVAGAAVEALGGVFRTVFGGISTAVEIAMGIVRRTINLVIDGINAIKLPSITIGGFDTPLGRTPGFTTPAVDPIPDIGRLHSGGQVGGMSFAGLRNDEVAAILKRGETVLTTGQTKAVGGGTVVQFNGGQTFNDGTDADLVAQRTVAAMNAMQLTG